MLTTRLRRLIVSNAHYLLGFFILMTCVAIGTGFYFVSSHIDSIKTIVSRQEKNIDNLKAGISQDNIRRRNIIATEKIIEKVNPKIPYEARLEYASYFVDEVEKMPRVDLPLALAVATSESHFNPDAVTFVEVNGKQKLNAVGIYQIVKMTGRGIASDLGIPYSDSARFDPRINIKMGIYYIQQLIDEYDGSVEHALAHYLNGWEGVAGWSYRKKHENSSEYREMTKGDILEVLNKLTGFRNDTGSYEFSKKSDVMKYREFLYAKQLPAQAENGVPKIMNIRQAYAEYFRNADIYFTPTTKAVIDTGRIRR